MIESPTMQVVSDFDECNERGLILASMKSGGNACTVPHPLLITHQN